VSVLSDAKRVELKAFENLTGARTVPCENDRLSRVGLTGSAP
jgi:hypothetical protein